MRSATERIMLDPDQQRAVDHPTNPLCILAPAGSGKTLVLTERIARRARERQIDIRRVLAITFTTKAAGELEDRCRALLGRDAPTVGTFHAIARRMLVDHHRDARRSPPTLLSDPDRLISQAWPSAGQAPMSLLRTEISWAQARRLDPQSYVDATRSAQRSVAVDTSLVATTYAAYRSAKRKAGVLDFDDLLSECTRLLVEDPAFAQLQRWKFQHFFVDEYQDVSPLQQGFLDVLVDGRDDLCVVGDANQAIYGFNGGDARYLTGFTERHRGATVIELTANYRSAPAIVSIAGAALGHKPRSRVSFDPNAVTLTPCVDENDEAVTTARRLRSQHLPGTRWAGQAVLVRTHHQASTIAPLLERSGIPVRLQGQPHERDAVDVLSFHSAKGLEWPIVHVAGIEEGLVPDRHARSAVAIDEERRLLYVALSRASRHLHLTWAARRDFAGRVLVRQPSRWLADIASTLDHLAPPSAPRRATTSVPNGKDRVFVGVPRTPRDRLAAWRAARAREARVPNSVVLSDRVLDELVKCRPTTPDELRAVPGIGPITAANFGATLLSLLGEEDST